MKLLPTLILLAAAAQALAEDWPQWRGPRRDGCVSDPKHRLATLPAEPKVLWRIDVGEGHASPVLAGTRLVYLDAQGDQESAHCVDAATGKPLWTTPIGPLVEFFNYGHGPRCTPLIDEDRVYVQTSGGEFSCLKLADGKRVWGVSFGNDYGAVWLGNNSRVPEAKETASRRHGNNGSAVVDGTRIFVPVGSPKGATLVCFDKLTGKEIWRAGNDNTAYASVMVGTLAGVRQAIHFTADALMGVEAATGKILWRTPLKTGAKRHVCTPVLSGDTVVVTSTNIGTLKFRIVKKGDDYATEPVWSDLPIKTILGTPVLLGKNLFTLGPGEHTSLLCLDFESGEQRWAQAGYNDYASITAVNDRLLILNSTGELSMVKASPEKCEDLGRAQVCGKTWASPAYADGKLYVKDDAHLTALALE